MRAAFTDAFGGEEFDEVGALLFSFANEFTKFLGRAALFREGLKRGEHARAGEDSAGDSIAQVLVFRRAGGLNSGEARVECEDGVVGSMKHGADGRLFFSGEVAVVKVPEDMGVRINPAGRDGQAGEVIDDRARRCFTADARDLSPFDDNNRVVQSLALTVENCRGFQDDGAFLRTSGQR